MVAQDHAIYSQRTYVSVLALSSRFDGRSLIPHTLHLLTCFSTRSVESF